MDPQQMPPQNPANQPYMPPADPGSFAGPGVQSSVGAPYAPVQNPLVSVLPPASPYAEPAVQSAPVAPGPTEITTTIPHDPAPQYGNPAAASTPPMYDSATMPQPMNTDPGMAGMPPTTGMPYAPQPGLQPQAAPGPVGVQPPFPASGVPTAPNQANPVFPGSPAGGMAGGVSPSVVVPPHAPAGPPPPVINGQNEHREPKVAFLAVIGVVVLGLAIAIAYLISHGK